MVKLWLWRPCQIKPHLTYKKKKEEVLYNTVFSASINKYLKQ